MDEKKTKVVEETKEEKDVSSMDTVEKEATVDKKEEKKASAEKEDKDEKKESAEKEDKKISTEKEDKEEKEESVEKEDKEEKKESVEKEDKEEKKESEEKEDKTDVNNSSEDSKNKTGSQKKKSRKKKSSNKSNSSNKDNVEKKDSKKDSSDKKDEKLEKESATDKKDEKSEKESTTDKKDTTSEKSDSKAISQSKRLADAKAVADANKTEISPAKKQKNPWLIAFVSLLSIMIIAYVAGWIYFSFNFYPEVAVNGVNVSNLNEAEAKAVLDDFYKDYALTFTTIEDKEIEIKGSDIETKIVLRDELDDCLKGQEAYLWIVNMFKAYEFKVGADATWNQGWLDEFYDSLKMLDKMTMTTPKDAYVGVVDGKFEIVEEVLGTTIDVDKFKSTIEENLATVQAKVDLHEAGCYKLPNIYSDNEELISEFEEKSKYSGIDIKIQLDDLTLEPQMELYDAVLEKSGDTYVVSKILVGKYVKALADQYDTFGKERIFTTSFNSRVVKMTSTAFGYEMNQEETVTALYKALGNGKSTTVEAVFDQKGISLLGKNDIGNTYIEVNLSEQKVIGYKDGKKIAEGDCVSGKEATGDGTCLGMYVIQDKKSPTVLRGQQKPVTKKEEKIVDGEKVQVEVTTMEYEYESPVTFWMQFNGGYGLHDAAGWRSVYGGDIYYWSGSHGCVNLPYDLAKKLYENFDLGDPVIVYFYDMENRK